MPESGHQVRLPFLLLLLLPPPPRSLKVCYSPSRAVVQRCLVAGVVLVAVAGLVLRWQWSSAGRTWRL